MTSSESINYSQYSIINEQNNNISNDLEIIDTQTKDKTPKELSQILVNENSETKNNIANKDNNSLSLPNDSTKITVQQKQSSFHNLLYGNPIDTTNPKYIGKSYAFLYDNNGEPKITIGPDCKYIFY